MLLYGKLHLYINYLYTFRIHVITYLIFFFQLSMFLFVLYILLYCLRCGITFHCRIYIIPAVLIITCFRPGSRNDVMIEITILTQIKYNFLLREKVNSFLYIILTFNEFKNMSSQT